MPPVKKTYSRISSSNKTRFDIITSFISKDNPIKKKKNRRRKKIVIQELPARTAQCILTNSSIEVQMEDTFDRLRKDSPEENKIINASNKMQNITVEDYSYSPIMTRNRALTLSRIENSSIAKKMNKTCSNDSSISRVLGSMRTLDRSVSESLCIEKVKPKNKNTFNLSSLLSVSNKSLNTSYKPMFSDTFNERYRNNPLIRKAAAPIPSSTPIVQISKADISVAISPIRNVTNENINTHSLALFKTPKVYKRKPVRKISVVDESSNYDKSEIIFKDIFDSGSSVLKDVSNVITDNIAESNEQILSAAGNLVGDFKHFDSVEYSAGYTKNVRSNDDDGLKKITTQNDLACAIIERDIEGFPSKNNCRSRSITQNDDYNNCVTIDNTENCVYAPQHLCSESSKLAVKINNLPPNFDKEVFDTDLQSQISNSALEDNSEMVATSSIKSYSKQPTTLENISHISNFTTTDGPSTNEILLLYEENNPGEDSLKHSCENADNSRIGENTNGDIDKFKETIDNKNTSQNSDYILIDTIATQNSINSCDLQDSVKELELSTKLEASKTNILEGTILDHETSCFTDASELSTTKFLQEAVVNVTNIDLDQYLNSNFKTSNDRVSAINDDSSSVDLFENPKSDMKPRQNNYITLRRRRITIKPFVKKDRKKVGAVLSNDSSLWNNSDSSSVCKTFESIRNTNFEKSVSKEMSIGDDSNLEESSSKLISLDNTELGQKIVVNIKRLNVEKIQSEAKKRTLGDSTEIISTDSSSVCNKSLESTEDTTIDDSNFEKDSSKEITETLNLEMISTNSSPVCNKSLESTKDTTIDDSNFEKDASKEITETLNLEMISTNSSPVCNKSLESTEDTTIDDSNFEKDASKEITETLNLEIDNDEDTMSTDDDSNLEKSGSKLIALDDRKLGEDDVVNVQSSNLEIDNDEVTIDDEVKIGSKQINLDNTKLGQKTVVNIKRLNIEKIQSETNKRILVKRMASGGHSTKSTEASPEEQPSKRSKTMKITSKSKPGGYLKKSTENVSSGSRPPLKRSKSSKTTITKTSNQSNPEDSQSHHQTLKNSKSLGGYSKPESDDETKNKPDKVFLTPKIPRRKLQRKTTLPIIDEGIAAKEAIMRSFNTHELTFKDPAEEDVVILRPGKLWRRSLLEVRNSRADCCLGNQSSCVALKGIVCTCIQCKRDNIGGSILPKRLSVRVVPLSPVSPAFTSISYLENYAVSLYPSYISDGVQESILEDYEYLENLSLSGGQKTFQHLPHHREPDLGRALTARDVVLRKCKQTEPLLFEKCYPNSMLQHCQKIGEGVYGEVFLFRNPNGGITVMKIIPIEGTLIVNGERQKKFEEILSEITIAMELSNLRNNHRNNTNGFTELQKVMCVKGKYPERLLELWDLYGESHGTENDSPEVFDDDQLYIILELANGGKDMEAYVFNNAQQAFALFQQIACALAVAEASLEFEHRDLHWGNILISNVDTNKTLTYYLNGKRLEVESNGVQLAIIDYTLSRIKHDGICIYNDLSLDPDLFNAKGDYQFDIYRMMRECNKNDWQSFRPFTNVLWLHYVLEKMIAGLRYKNKTSKVHKEYIKKLQSIRDDILSNKSAVEFVTGFLLDND